MTLNSAFELKSSMDIYPSRPRLISVHSVKLYRAPYHLVKGRKPNTPHPTLEGMAQDKGFPHGLW